MLGRRTAFPGANLPIDKSRPRLVTTVATPARFLLGRDGWAICICAIVSFAAHAAALVYVSATGAVVKGGMPSNAPAFKAHARLRPLQSVALPSTLEHAIESPRQLTAPIDVVARPDRLKPIERISPALAPAFLAPEAPAQQDAHAELLPETQLAPGELDGYLPRPLLTQAPLPRAPVQIHPPDNAGSHLKGNRYVSVLSLFIDENGEVRHIAAGEPPLPIEFEQAAREAFLAARFMPGVRDGHPVKSRLQVEVVFDTITAPRRTEDQQASVP